MAHYAKIVDGIVSTVIVAEAEFFDTFVDSSPGTWLKCSYNTRGNIHYGQDGQPDGGVALRGNYPGIGFKYDATNDVFYPQSPFASWILNEETWTWEAPTPMPTDDKMYKWDEATTSWIEFTV
jgi:hypothetical protein